jgi:ABC-2 type transport system ATP-binding protein
VNIAIEVKNLTKNFKLRKKGQGSFKSFFMPEFTLSEAVRNLSFSLEQGERVAFVGPNGAGKSTTIKMLCGILHPDSGDVQINGLTPWIDRSALARQIGTVFGQRSQLWYHLPASDTFDMLTYAYELDPLIAKRRIAELLEAFAATDLVHRPVRQLSLGERMRCEIIASLIHKPKILFLDEPTVGLDVVSKGVIRDLVRQTSDVDGTTVLLTSHDTGDMERVCDRVIVIDHGQIVTDQKVKDLRSSYIREKVVTLAMKEPQIDLDLAGVRVLEKMPHHLKLAVSTDETSIESLLQAVMPKTGFDDLTIEDPSAEDIIKEIYRRSGLSNLAA